MWNPEHIASQDLYYLMIYQYCGNKCYELNVSVKPPPFI